jgi:hypothetical protein
MRKYVAIFCSVAIVAVQVIAQDSIKAGNVPQTTAVGTTAVVPSYAVAYPSQSATLSAESIAEIETQARLDAHADIKSETWFLIGCLTSLTGWLIAYVVEPSPPVTRILGRSPEYVAVYSDTYKREGKKIQTSKAFSGCVVQTLAIGVFEAIMIVIALNAEPTYY